MRHADQSGHDEIGIRNASFKWSSVTTSGSLTPVETGGRRHFVLGINGDLFFKKGCVNLIIGPTGSGKSSLLMALLSEMHYMPAGADSFCNLPRTGGVAYAAQESWVQNETIRVSQICYLCASRTDALKDNILFGVPFEEDRYRKGTSTTTMYHCET